MEPLSNSREATAPPDHDGRVLDSLGGERDVGRQVALQERIVQFGFSSANPAQRPTPRSLGAQVSDQLEAVFERPWRYARRPLPECGRVFDASLAAAGQGTPIVSIRPLRPDRSLPRLRVLSSHPRFSSRPRPRRFPLRRRNQSPARETKHLGMALLMLIVLAGGTVVFSATELKGARETRAFISSVVDVVREKAAQWLPAAQERSTGHRSRRSNLPSVGGQAGTSPECPPGTRRVISLPAKNQNAEASPGEAARDSASKTVCVDEHPVSEVDYAACAVCEQPRPPSSKSDEDQSALRVLRHGKRPAATPIQCTTWTQAEPTARAAQPGSPPKLSCALPPRPRRLSSDGVDPGGAQGGPREIGPFRCASSP